MTLAKPVSELLIQLVRGGTFNLRGVYALSAELISEATSLQADALKKQLIALHDAPVTEETALSDETWHKLRQMGESFWEIRSTGNTSLNGDSFRLKTVFYDYLAATFKKAVEVSSDPAREVYGLTNRLIDVLKFMDAGEETLRRFCSLVDQMDPNSKPVKDSALQKVLTYRLQPRHGQAPAHLLGVELAYRLRDVYKAGLVLPAQRQPRPEAMELRPFYC
ncbi:MAG: hypothetical protein EBQ96_09285 [Proteobacteria bacterium]|nr:hypothetical protein [Pseudomonadota bacterium]